MEQGSEAKASRSTATQPPEPAPCPPQLEAQGQEQAGIILARVLVSQCVIGQARAGAILAVGPDLNCQVVAVCPSPDKDPAVGQWVQGCTLAARQILADKGKAAGPWQVLAELPPDPQVKTLLVSMDLPQMGRFVELFALGGTKAGAQLNQHRLVQTARMIEAYDQQLDASGPAARLQVAGSILRIVMAIHAHLRFVPAAMEFCNQLAAAWGCDRVSVGFLCGQMVRVKAISHADRFSRKTRLVQLIESAMEECLDQDTPVLWPADQLANYVWKAAKALADEGRSSAVLAVPLRDQDGPKGVVVLERSCGLDRQALGLIKLTCQLCGPPLLWLSRHDRFFVAKAFDRLKAGAAVVVGPRHTCAKVAVCLVAAFLGWVCFAKGTYRVHAPFVMAAEVLQGICAPYDGYLSQVSVDVGQVVQANETVLAELDTAELRLQLASARAELASYLKQADAYMRDGQTASAQIAQSEADKVQAQIDLLEDMIAKARLVSPITGTVVRGDLKRQIGSPVKTGQVLFEVTPLESLYAELLVPEDQVLDVAVGQEGRLATASLPTDRLRFVIERIDPMAEVTGGRNVFKVRARLAETRQWIRPGMEGVAKVAVDKRLYIWIWTRKLVNWIRMKFWI